MLSRASGERDRFESVLERLTPTTAGERITAAEQAGFRVAILFNDLVVFERPVSATGPKVTAPGGRVNGDAVPPKLESGPKAKYTTEALKRGIEGIVVLECVVDADGTVGRCVVIRSLDREFGLDDEAVRAVQQWCFTPATLKGQPTPVLVTLEVTFTVRDQP